MPWPLPLPCTCRPVGAGGDGSGTHSSRELASLSLTKGHQNTKACSYAARWGAIRPELGERRNVCRDSDSIRSGSRYAKWAGGSRSQTHRLATKGCFTQDDGYVQGLPPTHTIFSFRSSCCTSFCVARATPIILSSIPILVPGQYHLSLCLE